MEWFEYMAKELDEPIEKLYVQQAISTLKTTEFSVLMGI